MATWCETSVFIELLYPFVRRLLQILQSFEFLSLYILQQKFAVKTVGTATSWLYQAASWLREESRFGLGKSIEALAEEYDLIQSIPGIGPKIAATNLAEIGEIDRFDHAKKLVAFAGIDPSVFSSGKFTATRNKITKHGSRRLRTALYQAVRCGLRSSRNKKIRAYYDQKRAEGKLFKVAVIACVNKLIHWIYAILTKKETYRLGWISNV
jgi:hypothetical protein